MHTRFKNRRRDRYAFSLLNIFTCLTAVIGLCLLSTTAAAQNSGGGGAAESQVRINSPEDFQAGREMLAELAKQASQRKPVLD